MSHPILRQCIACGDFDGNSATACDACGFDPAAEGEAIVRGGPANPGCLIGLAAFGVWTVALIVAEKSITGPSDVMTGLSGFLLVVGAVASAALVMYLLRRRFPLRTFRALRAGPGGWATHAGPSRSPRRHPWPRRTMILATHNQGRDNHQNWTIEFWRCGVGPDGREVYSRLAGLRVYSVLQAYRGVESLRAAAERYAPVHDVGNRSGTVAYCPSCAARLDADPAGRCPQCGDERSPDEVILHGLPGETHANPALRRRQRTQAARTYAWLVAPGLLLGPAVLLVLAHRFPDVWDAHREPIVNLVLIVTAVSGLVLVAGRGVLVRRRERHLDDRDDPGPAFGRPDPATLFLRLGPGGWSCGPAGGGERRPWGEVAEWRVAVRPGGLRVLAGEPGAKRRPVDVIIEHATPRAEAKRLRRRLRAWTGRPVPGVT